MRNDLPGLSAGQVIALAAIARALFVTINARLLTLLSMLFAAAGFAWVMLSPDYTRFASACAFALLVFWPCQRLEQGQIAAPPAAPPPTKED